MDLKDLWGLNEEFPSKVLHPCQIMGADSTRAQSHKIEIEQETIPQQIHNHADLHRDHRKQSGLGPRRQLHAEGGPPPRAPVPRLLHRAVRLLLLPPMAIVRPEGELPRRRPGRKVPPRGRGPRAQRHAGVLPHGSAGELAPGVLPRHGRRGLLPVRALRGR